MKSPGRSKSPAESVRRIYRILSGAWGPQHWWPAETPFEVIIGAILTQNTSWTNVEKAIANLRAAGAMNIDGIRGLPTAELEQRIRPSGYFRQKAARLKEFVGFLDAEYAGSMEAMLATPTSQLREQLLARNGIGRETADSILLYAGDHPVFVVDAYTRRVLERHEAIASTAKYEEIRELVERALRAEHAPLGRDASSLAADRPEIHAPSMMSAAARSATAQVFSEMHGLFVQLGKHYCAKRHPKCEVCPLGGMLARPLMEDAPPDTRRRKSRDKRRASRKTAKPRV